jgi:hypothetical protein
MLVRCARDIGKELDDTDQVLQTHGLLSFLSILVVVTLFVSGFHKGPKVIVFLNLIKRGVFLDTFVIMTGEKGATDGRVEAEKQRLFFFAHTKSPILDISR